MNKKGFTLVEIISTLVIIGLIGLVIGINLNKSFKTNEIVEYNKFLNMVESAADIYVTSASEIKNALNDSKGYYIISIYDLQYAGLLDPELINPKTGKKIEPGTKVKISNDANGLLAFEYNPEHLNESYLYAKNLVVNVDSDYKCNDYIEEYGSTSLYLVTANGDIDKTLTVSEVITKVTCNFNANIPGAYNIVYQYKDNVTGKEKSITRKITIYAILSQPKDLLKDKILEKIMRM